MIMATLCIGDWGCAASHMAFRSYTWSAPYSRRLPIFGDVWHLVAGLRYLPMGLLAYLTLEWGEIALTAVVNYAGWQVLKRLHRKDWGWHRWL